MADGYGREVYIVPPGGGTVDVTLVPVGPRLEVRVEVIDAATGAPVGDFVAFAGRQQIGHPPGRAARERPYPGVGGGLRLRFGNDPFYPAVFVRAEADGYRAAESEPVNVEAYLARHGDEPLDVRIELERADSIWGAVIRHDRRPVAGALVVLATDTVWADIDAETLEPDTPGTITARTDAAGRFELPPNPAPYTVAVVSPDGWAQADDVAFVEAGEGGPNLLLRGWAGITGRVFVDGAPDVGQPVSVQDLAGAAGKLTYWSRTRVGPDGTFELAHVRPGNVLGTIGGDGAGDRLIEFQVSPAVGATEELVYGVGRPVVGRIEPPEGVAIEGPLSYWTYLRWPRSQEVPVDADGVIDFDHLPPGAAQAQIGYARRRRPAGRGRDRRLHGARGRGRRRGRAVPPRAAADAAAR